MVSKAIESAQAKVEGFNFDMRKHVLEYDEVMNKHREVFYKKRREILERAENNTLREYVLEVLKKKGVSEDDYNKKEKEVGQDIMRQIDKLVCLRVLDTFWIEHLEDMEYLRDSVRLRAYGQQDPLIEYKSEGRRMLQRLLSEVEAVIANSILKAEVTKQKPIQPQPVKIGDKKTVGRNDPCPCGSGKKYKKCHGK
jgi:preprotein translocase subunit SecA